MGNKRKTDFENLLMVWHASVGRAIYTIREFIQEDELRFFHAEQARIGFTWWESNRHYQQSNENYQKAQHHHNIAFSQLHSIIDIYIDIKSFSDLIFPDYKEALQYCYQILSKILAHPINLNLTTGDVDSIYEEFTEEVKKFFIETVA